ncbi:MAG: hypothetical protein WCO60_05400 [Verrucomicrobiota bacterium]
MKISLQNHDVHSTAINILVHDRLKALARLRPIKAVHLLIKRRPPDSLNYNISAELHLDGGSLSADSEGPSFRAAFERVLQQLQTHLMRRRSRHDRLPNGHGQTL